MAYATLTQVKNYLGIEDTKDDALIAWCIEQAQALIDAVCHRTFEASADSTRKFDSVRDVYGLTLILDKDLCAITSITNGDSTTITSSQYVTEPRNDTPYWSIRLLSSAGLVWECNATTGDSENAISITGRWAYSVTAPSIVSRLCIIAAAAAYRQREGQNPIGDTVVVEGGLQLRTPKDITAYLQTQCEAAGLVRWV